MASILKQKKESLGAIVPSPAYLGEELIRIETETIHEGKKETTQACKRYREYVFDTIQTLKGMYEKGWKPKTKEELAQLAGQAGAIIWSNFRYSPTLLLFDSFKKSSSGVLRMDCDTSAIPMADILRNFGVECTIIRVQNKRTLTGHAILEATITPKSSRKIIYIETTTSAKGENRLKFHESNDVGKYYLIGNRLPLSDRDACAKWRRKIATTKLDESKDPFLIAEQEHRKGHYGNAIENYTQLIEQKKANAETYHFRASAYYDLRLYKKAVDDLNEAIKLQPDFAKAYILRSNAYEKLGKKELAEKDREKASELAGNP